MKKLLCLMLIAAMLLTSAVALADTQINPQENRGITPQAAAENEVEEGISPTTGLTLSTLNVPEGFTGMAATGRYLPMMVQIGNDNGGVGSRAPWGASYVDVVYEMPLHKNGATRLSFIYNDLVPDSVGYIRSARVAHAWLREEWGAGFLFYGQQEYEGTNVLDEFKNMGHQYLADGYFFSGIVGEGKPWKKYYTSRSGKVRPYHVNANVAAMYALIPEDYAPSNHAFKFTDDVPAEGDTAQSIKVSWHSGGSDSTYGSKLIYDVDSNTYLRYMRRDNDALEPWVDEDTKEQIAFANVIVQFTNVSYHNGVDAPVVEVIGKSGKNYVPVEGNADFFMCGKHIVGYWKHDSVTSRTVFYGPDGEEISLQRGKTLILLFPNDGQNGSAITYSESAQ
ncbi:MAG: DUF3048 C-terminal domain-containing protein [Christensenellaceae bacterium]|nr:DUF3048 C-terminal domain-containing protein [Christensenellaceae bacterium]